MSPISAALAGMFFTTSTTNQKAFFLFLENGIRNPHLGAGHTCCYWRLDLAGEIVGAAHWIPERFAGFSLAELACGHRASRKLSSRGPAENR